MDLAKIALRRLGNMPAQSPLMYFDMTATHRNLVGGGIRRVCMELARQCDRLEDVARAVVLDHGRPRCWSTTKGVTAEASVRPGDIYVVMDSFWEPRAEYLAGLQTARSAGARTGICVHDVIPLDFPGLLSPSYVELFEKCLLDLMPLCDLFVGNSRTTARRLRTQLRRYGSDRPVVWFHPGADVLRIKEASAPAPRKDRMAFISVGTLEPKKGYHTALAAFEQIWAAPGADVTYTIVGRRGWLCDALVTKIERHCERDRRLFWIEDADDARLASLIRNADCLLQASLAEGFGIPIVEAAAAGLPVIASDLPVFKEIGGSGLDYFRAGDSGALASRIEAAIKQRPIPARIATMTWAQSATQLVEALVKVGLKGT